MEQAYTAAIIGLGAFSVVHAQAYSKLPQVRLVAACDRDRQRQQRWAAEVGQHLPIEQIRFFDRADELLETVRPQVVSIVTKHDQHVPLTIAAARAGAKAILCEKPIAVDLAGADAAITACSNSGTVLAIGHQRRFDPEWTAALELVRSGAIGEVSLAVSRWPDNKKVRNYRLAELGGGALMWLSVHSVDLLRYFLGDVRTVTGHIERGTGSPDAETQGFACLDFRSGARATVECGPGIGPQTTPEHAIVFYGRRGAVHVCDGYGTRYRTTAQPRWQQVPINPALLPWPRRSLDSCIAEMQDLIACIGTGRRPRCSGEDGRAALEVIMGLYESERTGGPVQLPLSRRDSPIVQISREGALSGPAWTIDRPGA